MFKLILYTFLLLISLTTAPLLVGEELKDHESLAKAVKYVTDRYISSLTNTVIVMQKCKHCTSLQQNFHYRLMDFVLFNCNNSLSWLLFSDATNDQPWNFNVFIVDSVEAFNDQIKQIKLNIYETEFYFLVVFTHTKNMPHEELKANLVKIVESGLDLNIVNVVIMTENRHSRIIFYRSRVHGRDCGFRIDIERFNYFYEGKSKRHFLFPYRMRNFNNCTMRVAAHSVAPFFIFNGDKRNESHLEDSSRLAGIDGQLLRILEKTLKFRLKLIFPSERGDIFENGTTTGCWALLQNNTVDVFVSNYGLVSSCRILFTASYVYHQTPFVAVVRTNMQYSPLKQMLCPFKNQVWDLLLWLFVINLGLIAFLKKFANDNIFAFMNGPKQNQPAVFNLIVTFMGLPLNYLPQRNFARLLLFCWIFLTFMLRSIYQGKMFDSLRVARRIHPPRSLEGLLAERFHMISREYLHFYPRNLTLILNEDYSTRFAMLERADSSTRIASYALLDYLAHHNQLNWNTSRLAMVNDPLKLFQLVMYFKKHSRLKFAFDAKLKQLLNAGIVSHITKKYVKREFRRMNEHNLEVTRISFGMLFGLYAIFSALIGWATLIFVLEVLSRKVRLLRWIFNSLRFFN